MLHKLGGPGLILIGLADNSVVPLPGSMDVFTIILASHNRDWWFYYGAMATLGAVIGGYLTYRLAEKGGEETLEKKIGKRRAQKVYEKFQKKGRGFGTVVVGSILPPPFPIVPVLMAAGVLQYPRKKFLAALTVGRGIRFFGVAYIGHLYGESIIGFFSQYYKPVLYGLIGLAVLAGIGVLLYLKWWRPKHKKDHPEQQDQKAPARKRVA
ncbi:MAG TPA: VTT domain-containing protein [Terriglobales bacterium]|nr:VTT domain-containing protein [Terriglobales bacterium]